MPSTLRPLALAPPGLPVLTSVLFAITGLKWMRRGLGKARPAFHPLEKVANPANAAYARRFGSPFLAQFWLEWRRWD